MKCTSEEWDNCGVEKMGCAGCYYDNKYSGESSIPKIPIIDNAAMAMAVKQATEEAQNEIEKAIKKQFEIGIDIEEALNRTAEEMKNKMMFGI